jgi:hypothetical protein
VLSLLTSIINVVKPHKQYTLVKTYIARAEGNMYESAQYRTDHAGATYRAPAPIVNSKIVKYVIYRTILQHFFDTNFNLLFSDNVI